MIHRHPAGAARACLAAALFAAALSGTVIHRAHAATAPGAPPPAEAFFSPPAISDVVLSPDGDWFAMLARTANGRRQLVVAATASPHALKAIAGFSDADIVRVDWVNDHRLVYSTRQEEASYDEQVPPGLFAVDRDGTNMRRLVKASWAPDDETGTLIRSRTLPPNHRLLRTLRDGSDDVLVTRELTRRTTSYAGYWVTEHTGSLPFRLNTSNGELTALVPGELAAGARGWFADDQGHVRMASLSLDGKLRVVAPVGASTPAATASEAALPAAAPGWRTLEVSDDFTPDPHQYVPLEAGDDGADYVLARQDDTDSMRVLRPDGRPDSSPLIHLEGFDLSSNMDDGRSPLVFNHRAHRLVGIRYVIDAEGTAWLVPELKAIQARVDAHLPGLLNRLEPADCGCGTSFIVRSHSDRQPTAWFLYDSAKDSLLVLGQSRPGIDPRAMAATRFVRFKARDGLDIPAYVTRPAGETGPLPTVLLLHGGPWIRGATWGWEGERQFLATRGYEVVEPEFRGSAGYGWRLFHSGYKQWGRAMQDDVADAAKWAIAQKLAAPGRICLMGASYGGYATLMGLENDPDLFRCGVAASAPSNLVGDDDVWWVDAGPEWREYGRPVMVGDVVKDADILRAASPVLHADRLRGALLLEHGALDARVPIVHARKMIEALKQAGHPPTWIEYPDEAHGFWKAADDVDFHQRVAAFLHAQLDGAAASVAAASAP